MARLCATLSAPADCTTDCSQQEKEPRPWPWAQAKGKEAWAKPTWTRSHTDAQAHEAEFGPAQSWRRLVTDRADAACKQAASRAIASLPAWDPSEADDLAREVCLYLRRKAEVLLTSAERPPWEDGLLVPVRRKSHPSLKQPRQQQSYQRRAAGGGP